MSVFNDSQKRALLSGLLDIHRRLAEVELLLAQGADGSPFSRYADDLSAAQVTAIPMCSWSSVTLCRRI